MKKACSSIFACCLFLLSGNALAHENLTPSEAYDMAAGGEAYLLDVRTPQEWLWVGHPGENKQGEGAELNGFVLNVSYQVYKRNKYQKTGKLVENRKFIKEVKKLLPFDAAIITICRSGGRSILSAMALEEAGFTNVYNIATGFEGGTDSDGYRTVNGWKLDGLPYNYSDDGMYKD